MVQVEEWRQISGFPDYEVSNRGDVRVIMTAEPFRRRRPGMALKPGRHNKGYASVTLCREQKHHHRLCHRLVAEAFLGECPVGCEVNHKNGDKWDNRVENLEYVTHAANMRHARDAGRIPRGADHYGAKLTESDVRAIRQALADGKTLTELGRLYGVALETIRFIARGKTWTSVK